MNVTLLLFQLLLLFRHLWMNVGRSDMCVCVSAASDSWLLSVLCLWIWWRKRRRKRRRRWRWVAPSPLRPSKNSLTHKEYTGGEGRGSGYLPPPPPPVWSAGSSYAGGGRAEIKVEAGKFRSGIRSSSRDSWQNLERQSDAVPEKEEGIRRSFQPIKRRNWRKGTLISHYSRIMVVFLQMQGKKAEMVFFN